MRRHGGVWIVPSLMAAGAWLAMPVGAAEKAADRIEVEKCQTDPNSDIEVGSRLDGELVEILVTEGQRVKAGDLLARLEDAEAQATLAIRQAEAESTAGVDAAREQLELAKVQHASKERANQKSPGAYGRFELLEGATQIKIYAAQLKKAENDQRVARLMVKVAEARLRGHEIRAPLAGVVTRKRRDVGEPVKAREPVFDIIDASRIKVVGRLSVRHLRRVRVGQAVEMRLELEPQRVHRGRIVFVDPKVDPAAHQFRVKAEVDNPKGWIRPGQMARMTILCSTSPSKPETAPAP